MVTHEHAAYVDRCLASLAPDHHRARLEVLVFDNCSIDDSARRAAGYPWVQVSVNGERHGFSYNHNQGLRRGRGRYALLLNPDTEVRPGAIDRLVAFMDANPDVGLAGPRLLNPDGSLQHSCRRFPTAASVVARRTPLRRFLRGSAANRQHLMVDVPHDRVADVDWMLGACLITRPEYLRTVGLLDEGFFLYVEDIDWAQRAHRAGWRVCYVPDAEVVHHHLARTDRVLFDRRTVFHLRGMWRYFRKHLAPGPLRLAVEPERLGERVD